MKLLAFCVFSLLYGGALRCSGQGFEDPFLSSPNSEQAERTPATPAPASAAGQRYDVRGIFDPGFNNILAFALKVPEGWRMQQSFTRLWSGAMPISQIYVGLFSPEGKDSVEYLPVLMYHYTDGPDARRLEQYVAQHGLPRDPTNIAPLGPVDYLKKVFLPILAQAKIFPKLTGEHAEPPQNTAPNTRVAVGSVDGVLPSGTKVRLCARVSVKSGWVINAMVHTWTVDPILIQSGGDLDASLARAMNVWGSLVANPQWQREDSELIQRGSDINMKHIMDNARAQRDAAEERRQAINRNYEMHRRATDQAASAFCDYLGDRVLYENPNTGERTKVQNSGRYVYQDSGGNVLSTDAPLDATNVDWQRLHEVELKNY